MSSVSTKPLILLGAESEEHGGKDDIKLRNVSKMKGTAM
jgi:hypothetical protein